MYGGRVLQLRNEEVHVVSGAAWMTPGLPLLEHLLGMCGLITLSDVDIMCMVDSGGWGA